MSQDPPKTAEDAPMPVRCQYPTPCSELALFVCSDCQLSLCSPHNHDWHNSAPPFRVHQPKPLVVPASIEPVVPFSDVDDVINPYRDMFTCRPVEYLRKCFDELAFVLRWWVACRLDRGEVFFAQFSLFNDETGEMDYQNCRYICRNPNLQELQRFLENNRRRPNAREWRAQPWDQNTQYGLTIAFFQMWSSLDCGQLLKHLSSGPYFRTTRDCPDFQRKKDALTFLKQLRDTMYHRGFLSREIRPCINEYLITALSQFFDAAKALLPEHLHGYAFSTPYTQHRKQLSDMKHMLPFFRRQLELQGDAREPSRRAFEKLTNNTIDDPTTEPGSDPINVDVFLQSCCTPDSTILRPSWGDLAIVFACRYRVRPGALNVPDAVQRAETMIGNSTENTSPLIKTVRRWEFREGQPHLSSFDAPDPVSVTNNDLLYRAYDCLALILHEYLTNLLKGMQEDEIERLLDRDVFKCIKLRKFSTLPVLVRPSKVAANDSLTPKEKMESETLVDPLALLRLFGEKDLFPACPRLHGAFREDKHYDALSQLRAIRQRLAHQRFIHEPTHLNQRLVSESLRHIVTLVKLLEANPSNIFNERCITLRTYLQHLQQSIDNAYPHWRRRMFGVLSNLDYQNTSYDAWTAFTMDQIREHYANSEEIRSLVQRFSVSNTAAPRQPQEPSPSILTPNRFLLLSDESSGSDADAGADAGADADAGDGTQTSTDPSSSSPPS